MMLQLLLSLFNLFHSSEWVSLERNLEQSTNKLEEKQDKNTLQFKPSHHWPLINGLKLIKRMKSWLEVL
jgi:hypothetical protein